MSSTSSYRSPRPTFIPPLWILSLIGVGLLGWVLYELKEMVILLVLGFSITYLISPLLDWMERRGVTRPFGVILVGVLALCILLASLLTAIPTLIREYGILMENFPSYLNAVKQKMGPLLDSVRGYLPENWVTAIESGKFTSILTENENIPRKIAAGLWKTLLAGYDVTLALVNALLLPFLVYYLSVDYQKIYEGLLSWVPIIRRRKVELILTEIDSQVSAYVRGQLLVGFVLFCFFAVGLGILQIELWLLVAFISGFGNLVPYVGSAIGIVLATIMALVTYGDFPHVLAVWGIFALVQFLEGTFVTPKIIGDSLGLSPLMVILALLAGGSLFGLLGIFLAIPIVAALQVITRYLHQWAVQKVGT